MAVLEIGDNGDDVRLLQISLNAVGFSLEVDGDFGPATDRAVRDFQERARLIVDGKVGPQTQTALKQSALPVEPGLPEPDKSAIEGDVPPGAMPPLNVDSLVLLDTARDVHTIWIHCSATPEGRDYTVADIRAWHKARGWSDIGYHYVVYRDGRVMLGRPVGQVGSHVAGHNTGSIGVVYIGGVSADGKTPKDTRTAAQRSSLLWLVDKLARKHGVSKVRGHNEVAAKACPSFIVSKDPLGKIL